MAKLSWVPGSGGALNGWGVVQMLVRRAVLTASTLLAAPVVSPLSTAAAATTPPNDLLVNATVVTSLPYSQTLDTTAATADSEDSKAITPCFPSVTSHNSVWYSYAAGADTDLVVDVSDASFDPGVTIAVGDLDNQPTLQCTIGRTTNHMHIAAGQTATMLVYDPQAGGGTIDLRIFGAVVPPNDTASGATRITSLPFTDQVYVGLATTDAVDDQVAQACGLGPTPNSVWYVYTAAAGDGRVVFDTSKISPSFSSSSLIVATGSPGSLSPVSCGSGTAVVDTTPGTTYYALIFGSGDYSQLDVYPAPPPAAGSARFSEQATVDRFGVADLTGSYECTDATLFTVFGSITQQRRRLTLRGDFSAPEFPVCDGRRHALHVQLVENDGGRFNPGNASLEFQTLACNVLGCNFGPFLTQRTVLKPN
ncbi:MAG TPA: hypothetical protein VHT50_08835 [Mycobacterium sp.]|nr:hypothetical protein [Mycobacterium sp.]